ncbi:hypothetical protein [Paraburkholderia sp. DHOC27]|uniref:hypothetical protein n=1 Tax=Paraburkholderia sp. DHOC27 TaxID=2303330 RepID=UPI000E3D383D|nr:hypothetical protein [Paraburkholderia sp. DHOC27]RFU47673.1 hypothetical protein D0B32_08925 [Paraburkholderia sp. DHOC27]
MSYLRAASHATRYVCFFLFSSAVFVLWASLAAGAGFFLLRLPDVWANHINDENSRYVIMSVTVYALILGALFMIFAAGAIARLAYAVIAARTLFVHLRENRDVRRTRRDAVPAVGLHAARHSS